MSRFSPYHAVLAALTTELNSLANAARAVSAALLDNTTNADYWCDAVLTVTFGSAPTGSAPTVDLYLLPAADGTNAADGSSTVVPQNALYVGSFELRAVTTAQRLTLRGILLPPQKFVALALNSSGVAFPASGSAINLYPYQTA